MEVRKHISQMNDIEKSFLNNIITEGSYKPCSHMSYKSKERVISNEEIQRAIHNYNLIEFHHKDSNRVLIRGTVNELGCNICAVLDLKYSEIVTVYINDVKDNHYNTLDRTIYRKSLDVASLFKGKYKQNNTKLVLN